MLGHFIQVIHIEKNALNIKVLLFGLLITIESTPETNGFQKMYYFG